MKTTNSVTSIFTGYSPEDISRWCLVSIRTAKAWRAGTKSPSKRAIKLFSLYARGKILGHEWNGWKVRGDMLYDPANQPFRRQQMLAHVVMYQLANHCRLHHMHADDASASHQPHQLKFF